MQIYAIEMRFELNDERYEGRILRHYPILASVVHQLGDRVLCDDIR